MMVNSVQHTLNNNFGIVYSTQFSGEGVTGPLTQRLLAALIEENTIPNDAHKKHGSSDTPNNGSGENSTVSNITSMLNNGVEVEKRLRKELLDLGILDASDFPKVNTLTIRYKRVLY